MEIDLRIDGGRVVTEHGVVEGPVAVAAGKIVAIGGDAARSQPQSSIDVSGRWVIPGVVDPETHIGTWRALRPDVESETRAAVVAGVTTWGFQFTSPMILRSSGEPVDRETLVPFSQCMEPLFAACESTSMVDYFLTPIVSSDEQVEEIPSLARDYGVTSFKFYLHTKNPAASSWQAAQQMGFWGFDDGTVYMAMEYIASLGPPAILSLHCENAEIARMFESRLRAAGRRDMRAWSERSPGFLEAGHVRAYTYWAEKTGCPLYIQHVTNLETVREIERARDNGVSIIGQTGTHYLTLNYDAWKLNTPLKDDATIAELWGALREGRIYCLGSDHVNPGRSREEMEVPDDMWSTISGFPSRVEALLPLMLSKGVNEGRISMEKLVEVLCEHPARAFGLYPTKGAIAVGADADLVIVDLDRRVEVSPAMILSNAGWSIYEGTEVHGWPVMTFLRGRLMSEWHQGAQAPSIVGTPDGRYLRREISD